MSPGSLFIVCADLAATSETFVRRETEGLRELGWKVAEIGLRQTGTGRPGTRPGISGSVFVPALLQTIRHLPLRQKVALVRHSRDALRLAGGNPRPDLFLAQFAWTTADACALASRISGIPWACRIHAWDVFAQPLPLLRHRLASASLLLPCTQAAASRLMEAGLPPSRIRRIRHGVDMPEPAPLPRRRSEAGEHPARTILAIGRLVPKKGFDTLLRACALLPETPRRSTTLRLIGEGGQRLRLERLAEEVGLRGKKGETRNPGECPRSVEVEFSGALPHSRAMEELRKADLLVLPSRRLPSGDCDGVANVLLEAMANGVPVVTTTGGCAGEVLEHGRNGWLVPPDDPPALASAIRQLLDDDDLRASLAAAARKTLLARFSPGETLHKLSAALSGVVRQPDGSVRDTGF